MSRGGIRRSARGRRGQTQQVNRQRGPATDYSSISDIHREANDGQRS
jgi:hypothetical protein